MHDAIKISIDDREARSGVVRLLEKLEEVDVCVRRLPLGDFEIDDRFLFERKTLPDLAASVKEGRFFTQACRLSSAPRWTAIILEGTGRDLAQSAMRREALQGALITATLFLGIPLLRSRNLEETLRLMLYAARQGRAIISGSVPRKGRRYRNKRRLQSHILQGLPGIGPQRAKHLLARFGTVEAVFTASAEELAAVSGIGPNSAQMIRWAVEESDVAYSEIAAQDDPAI